MKWKTFLIIFQILIILCTFSCGLVFKNENNIPRKMIPDHGLDDIFIYSTFDNSKADTFTVISYNTTYDYDEEVNSQRITVSLNSSWFSESFFLLDIYYNVGYIYFKNEGFFAFQPENATETFMVNGTEYKNVYVLEEETGGDSDSIINKIRYHWNAGVISYRYENGDEYLLDTIIKAE